ncbi:MAG: PSD1 and planctomycete cytochrome C domain-containing protein [Rubripirellula sp.]
MNIFRFTTALLVLALASSAHADQLTPEELKFFETKIRPVLIKECYGCHSNKSGNVRGGLRLDSKELTHIGGSSGPAVVPGDLEESLLFNAILHEDFQMPPKRRLSQSVIDDFKKWIEMGAPDPRETKIAKIQSTISADDILQAKENFWAYKKPVNQAPPSVDDASWPRSDIDRFVLSKLEQSNLKPAEDAEAYKVLRRLCFDLVGLPPTPEQIEFIKKKWKVSPDKAVEFVVDRLLQKDQYGERWGRHWLDVARYGESTGREVNMTYPHAWRYRDYVIDSFNADKPFDQFVQEQIAGDLMPVKTDEDWAENLIATTFLAMGPKNVNENNRVQFAADVVDEQIDATTRVFLGMSVACARCHDHKFDPIPQTDYYAMAGLFRNMTTYFGNPPSEFGSFSSAQAKRNSSLILLPIDDPNPFDKRYSAKELADLKQEIVDTQQNASDGRRRARESGDQQAAIRNRLRTQNQLTQLSAKLSVVDERGNPRSYCMGVQEQSQPQNARVLVRGEIDQAGQEVQRGFPQVLCSTPIEIDRKKSGRLDLARWIGSDQNPLTARVMVNRIWQQLIGQGIVSSTENFGITGQAPSHPELLDYLAVRFIDSGWSVKAVVREIATSRVYRMSSSFDERNHDYDPDNAMVWRASPRRLDAEAIRDAMLSVSGSIDFERPRGSEVAKAGYSRVRDGTIGDPRDSMRRAVESSGPSIRNAIAERMRRGGRAGQSGMRGRAGTNRGPMASRDTAVSAIQEAARKVRNLLDMEDATFRSVYLPIVRDEVPRSLEVFDFADASTITGTRESSNTANQALYMMNNGFVITQSDALARRVAKQSSRPNEQLEYAFLLAYGRPPTSGERSATASFLRGFSKSGGRGGETLSALCQSLLASAEFRFVD